MKGSLKLRVALALGMAVLLAGCAVWAAPEGAKPEDAAENKVLATVEGKNITEEDLNMVLQSMGPQGMMMYGSPEGRQLILNELISMHLFALDGEKNKLYEDPEFVELLSRFRTQALAQRVMRDTVKDVKVSDEDAKKFYDEHPDQFMEPERVHASHILISDDVASADNIAKVQADLKAGVSFDEVAKKVSICPSAPMGGDLGEFARGQMVPEFEEAAFALKASGDVSAPVKTQFGWHIIKLQDHKPAAAIPFDQVKDRIVQELTGEKQQALLQAKTEELKKSCKVEVFETLSADEKPAEPASADEKK